MSTVVDGVKLAIMIFAGLFIGLLIFGNLVGVAEDQDLGTTGNATRTTLISNIGVMFTLLVITPIIVGAGLLMRHLGWFG
jgi:hypothetical protein